jgi:hypothetical protein
MSRDFRPSIFSSINIPWVPDYEFCFEFAEICSIFECTNRACCVHFTAYTNIFCQVAPLNLYIFGGWGRTMREHICFFFIDIPFKGCQGRSNRSSIVHAVSMTPHAPCMHIYFFCIPSPFCI